MEAVDVFDIRMVYRSCKKRRRLWVQGGWRFATVLLTSRGCFYIRIRRSVECLNSVFECEGFAESLGYLLFSWQASIMKLLNDRSQTKSLLGLEELSFDVFDSRDLKSWRNSERRTELELDIAKPFR